MPCSPPSGPTPPSLLFLGVWACSLPLAPPVLQWWGEEQAWAQCWGGLDLREGGSGPGLTQEWQGNGRSGLVADAGEWA